MSRHHILTCRISIRASQMSVIPKRQKPLCLQSFPEDNHFWIIDCKHGYRYPANLCQRF